MLLKVRSGDTRGCLNGLRRVPQKIKRHLGYIHEINSHGNDHNLMWASNMRFTHTNALFSYMPINIQPFRCIIKLNPTICFWGFFRKSNEMFCFSVFARVFAWCFRDVKTPVWVPERGDETKIVQICEYFVWKMDRENVWFPFAAPLWYSDLEEMARSDSAPCRPLRGVRNSLKGDVRKTGSDF